MLSLKIKSVYYYYYFLFCVQLVSSEFVIPDVKLEAFQPSGFRVSIPAQPGVELFAFHGKLNKPISQIEPGEFSADVKTSRNGRFTYFNPGLKLKPGDVINYWVFVQHEQLGYRKDDQKWTVPDSIGGLGTSTPDTTVPVKIEPVVQNALFEDSFDGSVLDTNKWLQEQYIPAGPDYEFVTYRKDSDVTFVADNLLNIKPKPIEDESQLREDIDLNNGCTRPGGTENQCYVQYFGIFQRPVISGKLASKLTFSYSTVEIKAKLPRGDWIYPEIYLEDVEDPSNKIWIAYSRGNEELRGNGGDDIGNKMLFGGPVLNTKEPERSKLLSSFRASEPLGDRMHTYTLNWNRGRINLSLDGNQYGTVFSPAFANSNTVRLVLGVGVGGVTDFPNNYVSKNGQKKPWRDNTRNQTLDFYSSRNIWLRTWTDFGRRLQIDYVKVTPV